MAVEYEFDLGWQGTQIILLEDDLEQIFEVVSGLAVVPIPVGKLVAFVPALDAAIVVICRRNADTIQNRSSIQREGIVYVRDTVIIIVDVNSCQRWNRS